MTDHKASIDSDFPDDALRTRSITRALLFIGFLGFLFLLANLTFTFAYFGILSILGIALFVLFLFERSANGTAKQAMTLKESAYESMRSSNTWQKAAVGCLLASVVTGFALMFFPQDDFNMITSVVAICLWVPQGLFAFRRARALRYAGFYLLSRSPQKTKAVIEMVDMKIARKTALDIDVFNEGLSDVIVVTFYLLLPIGIAISFSFFLGLAFLFALLLKLLSQLL